MVYLFKGAGVYSGNQMPFSQPTPAPRTAPSVVPQLYQPQIPSAQPVATGYVPPSG